MDRKKIILSAIAINAGLLILLFITALHHEEEKISIPSAPYVFESAALAEAKPLLTPEPPILAAAPVVEPEIVHKLPPLVIPPQEPQQLPVAAIPAPAFQRIEVTVKKGDTLDKIAKAHKVTIDEILRTNQLQSTFLRVGQVLKIPAKQEQPVKELTKDADYYIVKVGDTPWMIAHKHHIKVEELLKMNHLNSEKAKRLKPGDRLKVK